MAREGCAHSKERLGSIIDSKCLLRRADSTQLNQPAETLPSPQSEFWKLSHLRMAHWPHW